MRSPFASACKADGHEQKARIITVRQFEILLIPLMTPYALIQAPVKHFKTS